MRRILLALVCLGCFGSAGVASATMYMIDLVDLDGPHITGVVDTDTDTLRVTSWTENVGGVDFWKPVLPQDLIYQALTVVDGNIVKFEVPEMNWDGTIDDTWGFVAMLPNDQINWDAPYTEPFRYQGWGAQVVPLGGLSTVGSEVQWPSTPISANTSGTAVFDTVSVTVIPEPSTAMLLGAGLLAGLVAPRARRR